MPPDLTADEAQRLHREISRLAAGMLLFSDDQTRDDLRTTADRFAQEVISLVNATIYRGKR